MDEQETNEEDPLEVQTYLDQVRAMVDLNADGQESDSDLKPHEKSK